MRDELRGAAGFVGAGLIAWLAASFASNRHLPWDILAFPVDMNVLVGVAGNLMFVAAFIERAAEVIVSGTRMEGVSHLRKRVEAAAPAALEAQLNLETYRAGTQRLAFAVSVAFGLVASVAGVSCLGPLTTLAAPVPSFVRAVDILLTSLLLAGGADGIHRALSVAFDLFDGTRRKIGIWQKEETPPVTPPAGAGGIAAAAIPAVVAAPIAAAQPGEALAAAHVYDPGA